MKSFLTISLLLIFVASANAQRAASKQAMLTRAQIRDTEQMLSDLGYWTGPIDGVFDAGSRSALIAFQKWQGRESTGQLTIDELEAIRASAFPTAREIGYEHVEVDLDRLRHVHIQFLWLWER